jgi:hypothetical protein
MSKSVSWCGLVLIAAAALSACASKQKTSAPVIVADGTEMKQFEKLVMCGDMPAFVSAMADVGRHLARVRDEVLGGDYTQKCSIRLSVDQEGHITGREVLSCAEVTSLDAVLAAADPVPAPKDPCLLARLNDITLELKGQSKETATPGKVPEPTREN